MSVFTIYNHGTGGSRLKGPEAAEIVNLFGNNAVGTEGVDYMITEGVGGKGAPHRSLLVPLNRTALVKKQVKPGAVRVQDEARKVAGKVAGRFAGAVKVLPEPLAMQAIGIGVDENIVAAMSTLVAAARNGRRITTINMIGWSRGAVTCTRIAYFLIKIPELCRILVNIFVVDPVAWHGHESEIDAITLGSNINHYLATVSVHESRSSFAPIDSSRVKVQGANSVVFLPFPGIHSDLAKLKSDSGAINFHLCAKFLQAHGTPLSDVEKGFILSSSMLMEKYERIRHRDPASKVHFRGNAVADLMKTQMGSPFKTRREAFHSYHNRQDASIVNTHHLAVLSSIVGTVLNQGGSSGQIGQNIAVLRAMGVA